MHYRVPPHEVVRWPGWVLSFLTAYLRKVPFPEERIETAIAHMHATYLTAHHPNKTVVKLEDVLLFNDPFGSEAATSGQAEILKLLGNRR